MNDLFKPKPTIYKEIFKRHGIPVSHVAAHIGMSNPYIVNVINGIAPLTKSTKEKLQVVVGKLKDQA